MTPAFALFIALSTPPQYFPYKHWPPSLEPIIAYWSDIYQVQRSLAWSMLMVESGGNPRAIGSEHVKKNGRWVRGKTLAEGAFMIAKNKKHREEHVKRAGLTMKQFNPWNVSDSARVGMALMRWLLDRYGGDQMLAIASYNCGYPRLESALPVPRETLLHLEKVFGRKG